MPTFSRSLEQSLHRALALANERHHEYATLEHLLLALIEDQDAAAVMRACNVDLEKLRRSLVAYLESELDNLVTDGAEDSKPTAGFQRVIQRAVIHVQSSGREEVTGANVLVAIFAERESHAAYFLQEQDMTRYDAVNYISHGIAKRPGMSEARPVRGGDMGAEHPLLDVARTEIVVVIEPGLADADHLRLGRQRRQALGRQFGMIGRLMRMGPDRAPNIGIAFGDRANPLKCVEPGRDRQHCADAGGAGAGDDRVALLVEIGKIEVAVAVD